MCIIVYRPKETKVQALTKKTLQRCWQSNPHGAGYMFPNRGKVIIKKGFMKFKKFWASYEEDVVKYPKRDFVCHFRIVSAGDKTPANTHPHRIRPDLAFAHNGTIIQMRDNKSDKSDTVLFGEQILQQLPPDFYMDTVLLKLIENYISSDKMIFMDERGVQAIVNEALGDWDGGIWYSNYSYYERQANHSYGKKAYNLGKGSSGWGEEDYNEYWANRHKDWDEICQAPQCMEPLIYDQELNYGYCVSCLEAMNIKCPKKITKRTSNKYSRKHIQVID